MSQLYGIVISTCLPREQFNFRVDLTVPTVPTVHTVYVQCVFVFVNSGSLW